MLCSLNQGISFLSLLKFASRQSAFFSKLFEGEQASSQDVEESFFPLQARIMQQSATLLDAELSLEELYETNQVLSSEERALIKDYGAVLSPKEDDPFPKVTVDLDLQDCQGPSWTIKRS
ncbi:hypothetical protein AOLI_G00093600 [Acnodon oligacanthus]